MNLRDHKDWDNKNGLLSVSLEPHRLIGEQNIYVLLNGSTGNFCLDYSKEESNPDLAKQRAWSSDTGYYVKILPNDFVEVFRWWDDYSETLPANKVAEKPERFYKAITKDRPVSGTIVSFAKEAFIKLRNCIQQSDNGQASLRAFMYLLAALEENVDTAFNVDNKKWQLDPFDANWIATHDWEWLYKAFQKGGQSHGNSITPLVSLVLRHASNRLFQEAHREATRKSFQTAMFGGTNRAYDGDVSGSAFYTPTPIVRTIVQEALWALDKAKPLSERTALRILDPACGSAEFLREALRQLKMKGYTGTITVIGWDVSEIACEMARFVLHYESRTEWADVVEVQILVRDSMIYDWTLEVGFDLILMNPPFTAFKNLGDDIKSFIQEKLKGFIKHQPDAAALFWKNAAENLNLAGTTGLILPHSLLGSETYSKLRIYLKEIGMNYSLVGHLGSASLFEKAMIIPNVLVGTKKATTKANTVLWTDYQQTSVYEALRELRKYRVVDIQTPIVSQTFSIYENAHLVNSELSPNWTARSFQAFKLVEELQAFDTVGKLFDVKRGADAGNNAAFVLKKEKWESLPKKERLYFRPAILGGSIENGILLDAYYLFYPYGENTIETEEELEQKIPFYYKLLLLPNKQSLKTRTGREVKWWTLSRHRDWQEVPFPKLISAYFGKAGYFALDLKGDYLVSQSFAWIPKKGKEHLAERKYQFAYLGLLHAPLIDKLMEMTSPNIAGGQFDLSKHFVDKMPLPDLSKSDPQILSLLISMGEKIHRGESIDKTALNEVAAAAYGLDLRKFAFA